MSFLAQLSLQATDTIGTSIDLKTSRPATHLASISSRGYEYALMNTQPTVLVVEDDADLRRRRGVPESKGFAVAQAVMRPTRCRV